MPTVGVDAADFHRRLKDCLGLGDKFDLAALEKRIDDICFEFGLEYDGLEEDESTKAPRLRIEVPANRYDLLCIESICAALKHYLSPTPLAFPVYKHSVAAPTHTLTVYPSVQNIRPFGLAAIFRNVNLGAAGFASFIDLQDKLHQNIGRRRTLVAIGTHNYDVLKGTNFSYQALPKKGGFKFVPLTQTQEVDAEGMFELLEHTYIKPYLHITRDSDLTPVFLDEENNVLSVPPIINSEFSKMSAETRNIFVDITATDLRKAEIVLDTLTAALSERLAKPFTVEPVRVIYKSGHKGMPLRKEGAEKFASEAIVPRLQTETFKVSLQYVRHIIGFESLSSEDVLALLPKMMLRGTADGDTITVECPITRRDVLHPCDIAEDLAIAYGYNKIASRVHAAVNLQPIQNLSERVRRQMAMAGWRECLTFGLVSLKDAYTDIRRTAGTDPSLKSITESYYSAYSVPATVSEPKTRDFECARPTLIPGILKTLSSNQAAELPIKLFELGDCVMQSSETDNKVVQRRHVAGLVADHNRTGLEEVHGLLDVVLKSLKLGAKYGSQGSFARSYRLTEIQDGPFLDGRCVAIEVYPTDKESEAKAIGVMGVVHPLVLQNHSIPFPCALFEFSLEPFLGWLSETEVSAP
eukprot:Gregarina_sp_Pseudo_9__24@NODE_1016_length_1967_cov_13_816390_g953_i0_p1_GENE_NODE_1016_length_1967_cov_13_816390_g953_i0NODE_1016_length_1967_cov_13_816390_g953_i0_p1_ORF_typecomplete_len638_score184_74tRNA_synthFbeta/PF17759_1/2_7e48B3_4/PF03483_17/1_5e24B5/PF03484_15/6_2B5/PF03484_15/6_8e17PhetRS_B1/PF18262_1/2_7e18PhetRS_B1/PF18262_1/6_9e03_NODE_1016_length_1967_cov_13_816390_g953_i0311944